MRLRVWVFVCAALVAATAASAATVSGLITDATGAPLPGTRIVLRDVATGSEQVFVTSADGKYRIDTPTAATYLLIARRTGFSEAARTVVIAKADEKIDLPLKLEIGPQSAEVTVTAARSEREIRQIPLHVETLSGTAVAQTNPLSTGTALTAAVSVTPVGDGPFGVRPRLRGLDSTRMLVLVDGERLNTARQATDRTGAEVGLISPDTVSRMEIVNGAGTLMYGSDALAGTINIVTNEFGFSSVRKYHYGLDGYFSSNDRAARSTLTFGVSAPRFAIRVQAGGDRFENYRAGSFTMEDTAPLFAGGALRRADTIDDNFGFNFKAFPDPFNAPYVRTSNEVLNSQARSNFVNVSGQLALGGRQIVRLRYQRRRTEDIGFPDFAQPYFFNPTSLPKSDLDRASVSYEAQAPTSWLANLSVTAGFQRTDRLLRNLIPVQFPVPSATFFPITVMRLDIVSETEQRVWTPTLAVRAAFVPAASHLVTAGLTVSRDRSSDLRTTSTTTSMVGQVALGQFGPAAIVFPSPTPLGPASISHPVRVPDASLRDFGVFVQDEWRLRPQLSLIAGLRGDLYRVTSEATPGYNVAAVVAGATPAIDPASLPDGNGATYSRRSLTGDLGLLANASGRLSPFVRIGRSYRHPNLEEMLFAGPATIGSIAPNVNVRPETGTNFDAGVKFRIAGVSGGVYAFANQYRDFIAQDLVVATTPAGPLAQATNYAHVRIAGVEFNGDAPIAVRSGVLTLSAAGAFLRGNITSGTNPLDGTTLDGTPMDNITPFKFIGTARFTQTRGRFWVEYGVRAQRKISRVALTLLDSPFLIAQDLLSLDGFAIQRLGWGVRLLPNGDRLHLTFAIENLANRYYREQFQFAPARGRTFTVAIKIE